MEIHLACLKMLQKVLGFYIFDSPCIWTYDWYQNR